jgi:hypothetical protein
VGGVVPAVLDTTIERPEMEPRGLGSSWKAFGEIGMPEGANILSRTTPP